MAISLGTLTASKESDAEPADSAARSGAPAVNDRSGVVDRLFARYRMGLLRYVARLVSSADDAEDVVQETYARLLEARSLDAADSRVRAYMFRIATNLVYDRFRAQRRHGTRVALEESELSDTERDPGRIVSDEQCMALVKKTLLELRPRSRKVFLLRVSKQLSYQEIAERLGVSTRTVEREMRHAIDRCQRRLNKEAGT